MSPFKITLFGNFICPNCNHDQSSIYIKDQFIWGITNDVLQVDMQAKTGSLKTLELNISHEMAMRNQDKTTGGTLQEKSILSYHIINIESGLMDQEESHLGTTVSRGKSEIKAVLISIPSATPVRITSASNAPLMHPDPPIFQ